VCGDGIAVHFPALYPKVRKELRNFMNIMGRFDFILRGDREAHRYKRGHDWSKLQISVQNTSYVIHRGQIKKERAQVSQLRIMRIVKPRGHGDGVVRLEEVRSRRVIEDYRICYRSPQL
jgi:hypothetical protein